MGCTSSTYSTGPPGPGPLALFQEQIKIIETQQTLDVRSLMIMIWRARTKPDFQRIVTELVTMNADDRNSFVGIEFYLPQLVHMMVHLEVDWPTNTLEEFALLVSQQSMHIALQMCWILMGLMEDYQSEDPEGNYNPSANPLLYNRCATMMEKLELSVVFGSPNCSAFEQLYREGKVTRAELAELQKSDRKAQALLISDQVPDDMDYLKEGNLLYKRWKRRSGMHMDKWIERRFVIGHRVLYCLRKSDNVIKRSIALHDCTVHVPSNPPKEHPWYFEIHETDRDRKFLLVAGSEQERNDWVQKLNEAINSPPKAFGGAGPAVRLGSSTSNTSSVADGSANIDVNTLSPSQVARYGFYRSERDFVRLLTDICEELRFVDVPKRKEMLRERLRKITIPGCVYIPLCGSTDTWERIVKVVPDESTAFSTRARCPCLMTFEMTTDDPEKPLDVATYLYQTLGFDPATNSLLEGDFEEALSMSHAGGDNESITGSVSENEVGINGIESKGSVASSNSTSWESARRRALARSRFVRSARSSVTSLDMSMDDVHETASTSSVDGNMTHRHEASQSVDMPNLWFDYEPQSRGASDVVKTGNGTVAVIGKSAISNDNADPSFTDSKSNGVDYPHSDRKSLVVESLILQANELFGKVKAGSGSPKHSQIPPSSARIGGRPHGVFLPALGKYVPPRNEDLQEVGVPEKPTAPGTVHGSQPPVGKLIAKSNDDLRQEVFIMQLISFLHDIWANKGLRLWLRPYKILSTSQSTGMLEVLRGSNSLDGVKKDNDKIPILDFLKKQFPDPNDLAQAQRNFTESMAGYSLACYILGIKDRHNGNIMLEYATGRIIHIDFGFVFGMAPGKDKIPHVNLSFERAAFKLTPELVNAMGGFDHENWKLFNDLMLEGIMEARRYADTLVTMIEITGYKSRLPCFNQPGGGVVRCVRELKERLMLNLPDAQVKKRLKALTEHAATSTGTHWYELFQLWSNKIEPVR
mmetsp:Transcript_13533/g.26096  ORF Transcript_13533/g.26096 Transcript_13533/m.26096 type:complete len:984 (-) Transcript_13533:299-3250(-)